MLLFVFDLDSVPEWFFNQPMFCKWLKDPTLTCTFSTVKSLKFLTNNFKMMFLFKSQNEIGSVNGVYLVIWWTDFSFLFTLPASHHASFCDHWIRMVPFYVCCYLLFASYSILTRSILPPTIRCARWKGDFSWWTLNYIRTKMTTV